MMMEKFRDWFDAFFLRRNPEFFVKSIFHGNFFIIMIFFAAFLKFLMIISKVF
jgi:hypothetical protein